jgi:polyhydroxyalkanoate synthesis regulator phasin
MDPFKVLLDYLRDNLDSAPAMGQLEQRVREIFAKFELVPKHELAAHLQTLATLEAQVATLERRLAALEESEV